MKIENVTDENLTKDDLLALLKEQAKAIYNLQHADRKYKNLFNNSLDGIYKSTPEGKFIDVNMALVVMLGYSNKEELLAIDINSQLYLNVADRKDIVNNHNELIKKRLRLLKKDGSIIWVEDYGQNIIDANGAVLYYEGIIRNVTEIKRASDIQKVLLKISHYGYRNLNMRDYNQFIISQLGDFLDMSNSYIAFYNNEKQTISIPFISGEDAEEEFPIGKSMTGYLIKSKKPILIKSAQFKELIDCGEVNLIGLFPKVWLGVPLMIDSEVIGAIVVQSYDNENAFQKSDIELLEFVSSHISLTIQRKKVENENRLSKEVQRKVLDNIPIKVFWKDTESKFLGCNTAYLDDMSINSKNELLGKTDFDLHKLEDAKKYRADEVAIMLSGKPKLNYQESSLITGKERWFKANKLPFFDDNKKVIGIIGTSEDITERRENEIKLKKAIKEATLAKEILRRVLDNIPIKVFWKDKESKYLGCNKAFIEDNSFSSETEIIGKTDFDFNNKSDAEKYRSDDLATMQSGKPKLNYQELFIINEKERWVKTSKLPYFDEHNEVIGIIGTSDDITEQIENEINLKKATESAIAANLSKSTFLSNMSHEIRTPMNAILGYSQLLQEDENLTKSQQENLKTINKSGEHLLSLINDILDMSKIEAGRMTLKPIDFNFLELIKEIEQLFKIKASQKSLELLFNIEKDVPKSIIADESKIKQVIINLVGNAIKFTSVGFIEISVSKISNNKLQVSIKDSGKGILKEEHELVFRPFEQALVGTKFREGTGLGLAISKKFSNLMKGDIALESEYGKGSIFSFSFEFDEGCEALLKEEKQGFKVIGLSEKSIGLKIAIVDDRFENRDILFQKLNPLGFEIQMAENGEEAVNLYKNWKPDIILMDVVMPVMDGVEATRNILEIAGDHEVKIFVVSASALESEQKEIMDLGATVFIKKPVIFDLLLADLENKGGVEFIYKTQTKNITEKIEITPANVPLHIKEKLLFAAEEGDFILLQDLLATLEAETNNKFEFIENCINEMEFEDMINWFES